jgi:hypothetical protein
MVVKIALACLVAAAPFLLGPPAPLTQEERPKVPKDSVMVVITGCIKGRVIRAADVRQTDTTSGVTIRSTTFRLAGKKPVMEVVKEQNNQRAEVTGLIKKSSLIEPGIKFKGGRVVIGGGSSAGSMGSMPSPAENVLVLDAISVQGLGTCCAY